MFSKKKKLKLEVITNPKKLYLKHESDFDKPTHIKKEDDKKKAGK